MFLKFNTADNASATLDSGISASTGTITLGIGQGTAFPSTNSILTLVQYNTPADPTSGVLKFEKVLMTSRSGDILTVTRGYDSSTATTFNAGDYVYLNVVSKIIKDIQDELTRLESDKLGIGALRTGLANAWRMFFSNGTNQETGLAFGNAGTVLTSSGASSAPSWEVPTVDISSLVEDNSDIGNSDYIVYLKNGTGNRKRLGKASDTQMGLVLRASDSDASTGTNTTKFITPKQASDNYKAVFNTGDFTYDATSGSSTTVIPHGLGRTPKLVQFNYGVTNVSTGSYDGVTNRTRYFNSSSSYSQSQTSSIWISQAGSVANTQGVVSWDATNITITWTKNTGGASGIATINWIAQS